MFLSFRQYYNFSIKKIRILKKYGIRKVVYNIWIVERKRSCGFCCIFTVAFPLFLAPVEGTNALTFI